jgi:hypothetical protein
MPLELFDYRLFRDSHHGRDPELQTPILMLARVDFMMKLFDEHYERLTPAETTLLRTVRRVDLLAAAPYEHLMGSGAKLAELIGKTIERMWRELGVEEGVVRRDRSFFFFVLCASEDCFSWRACEAQKETSTT